MRTQPPRRRLRWQCRYSTNTQMPRWFRRSPSARTWLPPLPCLSWSVARVSPTLTMPSAALLRVAKAAHNSAPDPTALTSVAVPVRSGREDARWEGVRAGVQGEAGAEAGAGAGAGAATRPAVHAVSVWIRSTARRVCSLTGAWVCPKHPTSRGGTRSDRCGRPQSQWWRRSRIRRWPRRPPALRHPRCPPCPPALCLQRSR